MNNYSTLEQYNRRNLAKRDEGEGGEEEKNDKSDKESFHTGKSDKGDKSNKTLSSNPISSTEYLKWDNKDSASYLLTLVHKFGPPTFINKGSGGSAIWIESDLKDTCYVRLELMDESIPHCVPKPHRDFFYTYIRFSIPVETFYDVLILSGSVSYDPLKRWLRARCASIEANNATLLLATEIANGTHTIHKVQTTNMYEKYINQTTDLKSAETHLEKLRKNIEENIIPPDKYFKLAFPQGCQDE